MGQACLTMPDELRGLDIRLVDIKTAPGEAFFPENSSLVYGDRLESDITAEQMDKGMGCIGATALWARYKRSSPQSGTGDGFLPPSYMQSKKNNYSMREY